MLLCIFLFTVALFVTTVIAKLLASYFHKQAFFDKMQETLKQVCACAVLCLLKCCVCSSSSKGSGTDDDCITMCPELSCDGKE